MFIISQKICLFVRDTRYGVWKQAFILICPTYNLTPIGH